jgi:hypothetical protein
MPFRFGIEVEFLLGSLKTQNVSQTALFREVKERLSEAGINSIVFKSNDKSEERYTTWSITTEVTVQGEPSQCLRAFYKPSTRDDLSPVPCITAAIMNNH